LGRRGEFFEVSDQPVHFIDRVDAEAGVADGEAVDHICVQGREIGVVLPIGRVFFVVFFEVVQDFNDCGDALFLFARSADAGMGEVAHGVVVHSDELFPPEGEMVFGASVQGMGGWHGVLPILQNKVSGSWRRCSSGVTGSSGSAELQESRDEHLWPKEDDVRINFVVEF